MTTRRRHILIRAAVALLAAAAIALILSRLVIRGATTLRFGAGEGAIELLEPAWLYLACLAPWFYFVRVFSLSDLAPAQQILAASSRALLLLTLAIALARPAAPWTEDRVATAILVDVSPSVSDAQLAEAQAFVNEVFAAKDPRDEAHLITFAARPRIVGPSGEGPPIVTRHEGEPPGTDLQAALRLAYGVFPADAVPRAVILSDGSETTGDIAAEAEAARRFDVKVSVQTYQAERTPEVRAVALSPPTSVTVGAPFELTAHVWSSHAQEVTLSLRQDDFPNALEPTKQVTLEPGDNRLKFKSEARAGGFATYKLAIRGAAHDTEPGNNATSVTVAVKGKPRILFVEGELERSPHSASYLQRALSREDLDVEVRGPRGVPATVAELARYDLLILSDVPATFLGLDRMRAIERYVKDEGGGFLMAGGDDSFGSGGYQGTVIEKLLPVRFEDTKERQIPRVALALVVDRSGSMSGQKIEMAKESARATAEILEPSDLISVVAFDNRPTTIVRLQKASNRLRIGTDISRLQPGGGTNILPALREAYNALSPARAKVKHVILLSDGQAPYDGISQLADEMRASGITVSAVGIGDADRNLLQLVAEHGEGRLYFTDNVFELPRIFMQETQEVQRSSLVEELVQVKIAKRAQLIAGTSVESAPPLRGYVSTKPKPGSEVILVSQLGEPLLARWRVGLGQVVAWTSDVKTRWARDWVSWPSFGKFWAQVIRSTMRQGKERGYALSATVHNQNTRVIVDAIDDDDTFINNLATELTVKNPTTDEVELTLPMTQTAPGRYEAELPLSRHGTFALEATHRDPDGHLVARSTGAVALPYPPELLSTEPRPALLAQVAATTGGTVSPPPATLWNPGDDTIDYHRELWPHVLLIALALFILDVFLRRVRLLGYRPLRA